MKTTVIKTITILFIIISYNLKAGCDTPLSSDDFNNKKSQIEKHDFDDAKKKATIEFIKANCFTSAQIKDLLSLFSFEEDKLSIAKEAYSKVSDPENFKSIFEVFDFESSKENLKKHIAEKK